MEKPTNYAIIPASVRYDNTLKPNEKLLYGEINCLCNTKGICWAGNNYFANLYGVRTETISRWISRLIERGYVKIKIYYKKGTKEIEKRALEIVDKCIDKNINTYCENNQEGIDENVKENNKINNNIYSNGANKETNETLAINFDKIWQIYPRKDGKNSAFNHYKSWLKGKKFAGRTIKLTNRQMWIATRRYADLMIKEKREKQYIKSGSTFFNGPIMEFVDDL